MNRNLLLACFIAAALLSAQGPAAENKKPETPPSTGTVRATPAASAPAVGMK
jgi:hypothetical protein